MLADYASETLEEYVPEAVVRKFRVEGGFLLVTLWKGVVHEVIYQTPKRFFWSRRKLRGDLLRYYGDGQNWAEDWPVDFGESRKREDGRVRTLYSNLMDFATFVTVEFDKHRSEIRWEGKLDNVR